MKQIAALSTNEIARYAAKNIVLNHVDMITATSKGLALEAMKKRMMRGEVVRFAYMKKDGSVRIAVGTFAARCSKSQRKGYRHPQEVLWYVCVPRFGKNGLAWIFGKSFCGYDRELRDWG